MYISLLSFDIETSVICVLFQLEGLCFYLLCTFRAILDVYPQGTHIASGCKLRSSSEGNGLLGNRKFLFTSHKHDPVHIREVPFSFLKKVLYNNIRVLRMIFKGIYGKLKKMAKHLQRASETKRLAIMYKR